MGDHDKYDENIDFNAEQHQWVTMRRKAYVYLHPIDGEVIDVKFVASRVICVPQIITVCPDL